MKVSDKDKAQVLNQQFNSVFQFMIRKHQKSNLYTHLIWMTWMTITTGRVKKLLDDLNVCKANCLDGIPAKMLNETSNEITESMTLLFKASLTQSDIPDTWREALISQLFKGGKKITTKQKTTDQ